MDAGRERASTDTHIEARIRTYLATLCGFMPDRSLGTSGNRDAVTYVEQVLADLGVRVDSIPFSTPGWRFGEASVRADGKRVAAHPGPYSRAFEGTAPLRAASCIDQLARTDVTGSVLLLHGSLADQQLTPRDYPWYANPDHIAILDAIEAAAPACVLAATGKSPGTTAALSPFPLIEDATFEIPSGYLDEHATPALLEHLGEPVTVHIDSERFVAQCAQPVGRLGGTAGNRVLITSHLDTKPETPGALDNAAGVSTMLAVAEILATDAVSRRRGLTVEFVAFNGEDHFASPGEVAYLDSYPSTDDISLVVNIDGAGYRHGSCAVSRYATTTSIDAVVDAALAGCPGIVRGEQWLSGDHAIFAMRGIPALALTSSEMRVLWEKVAHTPADTPDLVDPAMLAQAAQFIASVVVALDAGADHEVA